MSITSKAQRVAVAPTGTPVTIPNVPGHTSNQRSVWFLDPKKVHPFTVAPNQSNIINLFGGGAATVDSPDM